ncbi:adenylate/guanylate cyclase domain-containing protein [Leptonema illini]|uniref:Adenylate/guanylate cyclase with integral membrane sensor n=1 Tax=Leptonema illini DSM 21528 TaxID=929563 RepID=H2CFA6_9LEPT|nr:adenylate/guanylate cyclase domain-containing protein [Leptonema illini]EHQ06734.1 adenylate/guanylate cyclase with integral membrane sensor [Leptonema illini DSM 21528]
MIGNQRYQFQWALDDSLNTLIRHRGDAELSRAVREWKLLGIELVLLVDSGQGMALEFLARDILLQSMSVHLMRLEELFARGALSRFRDERTLLLHAESNEGLQKALHLDPVLDEPPIVLKPIITDEPVQRRVAPHEKAPRETPPEEKSATSEKKEGGSVVPFPSRPPAQKTPESHSEPEHTEKPTLSPPPTVPHAEVSKTEKPTLSPPPTVPQAEVSKTEKPPKKPEVAAPAPPPAPSIATRQATPIARSEIKVSRWNIKVKTIALLSALIVSALSAMIFWASMEFSNDVARDIEANATQLNEVVGQKVQVILEQTRYSANLIAAKAAESDALSSEAFQGNQDIFAIITTEPVADTLSVSSTLLNKEQMDLNGLIEDDLTRITSLYGSSLVAAKTGATTVMNASTGFRMPLIVMSFPSRAEAGKILVVVADARRIGESFLGTDASLTFMVDRNGSIVAHPDPTVVLGGMSVANLPVFQEMMKSTLDKAMIRYEYEGKWYRGAYKKLPLAGLGVIYTIEEAKAFARVEEIRNRNLYVLGIVLSLAILVGYFFARSLALPLRELVGATQRVENEDYSVAVEPRSGDEVGVLAASFNKMVNGLAERERMKDAFGRFVNKEVAERAMRGEIKLGGEKKECAVFFSDLRGFTAMSEKLQPEEVVEYLNRYFTLMVDCVDKSHGVVDKFIGDAVMATWGSVISHGNDTANAVDGALMMRKALMEFNVYNAEHGLPIAKFGCGINTGAVISGQIGSEKKLEFTVIGDAVNLASRIESLNKPFATDILISQDAYDRVADSFDVVKMPAIKVKGKSEPQTIYCVLGRKDDPDRPKNLDELRKRAGIDWGTKGELGAVMEEDKEEKYEIIQE